ncbi:MAG: alkaline shock response membrane anchor protein AmaP [Thermosediminibacteraceae bacterium]|nr:alkaline shock response membrane anchor protein AmaP [Thermosediminibacteraceae bacterium]
MKLFDRIILFFICFLTAVISAVTILFSAKVFSLEFFWTRLVGLYGRWEIGAVAVLFLVGCLWILFSGLRNQKVPETVISSGELGNVSVSFNAIENLILKVASNIEKIKDVKVRLKHQEGSLLIMLKVILAPDTKIPELTSELQKMVKDYLESMAGISVKSVSINVEDIAAQHKQKVK